MDGEYAVGPGGLLVHGGFAGGSVFETDIHELFHFGCGFDDIHGEVLDENSLVWGLFEVHSALSIFAQQIMNLFVINFDETTPNQMFLVLLAARKSDNLAEGSGDDALRLLAVVRTHHGMGFSAPGLPICEYCSIVALENIVDEGECGLFVDVALEGVLGEDVIEGKSLGGILGSNLEEMDLVLSRVDINNALTFFLFYISVLSSFYRRFMGRHLTMTFTHSVILINVSDNLYKNNFASHK